MAELTKMIGGVDFGEGPRWHDGRLWYSDFYQQAVYAVDLDGVREKVVAFDERPSGLGWLPDGELLIVSMRKQQVRRADGSVYADLSGLARGYCNDMVVDTNGNAFVGCFGFDLDAGEELAVSVLIRVRPDGSAEIAADDLLFPNGAVITADGSTLIVGETFGAQYTAFDLSPEGELTNRRIWARTEGYAPDGCGLDADGGIWFADAITPRVARVVEGGEITHEVKAPQKTYACNLGGPDGKTLFVLTAVGPNPDEVRGRGEGNIWTLPVDSPAAGLP